IKILLLILVLIFEIFVYFQAVFRRYRSILVLDSAHSRTLPGEGLFNKPDNSVWVCSLQSSSKVRRRMLSPPIVFLGPRKSAGSSPCIPSPNFNELPTGGRDRLDDPPIRQFFFDAAVIAEDVDRLVMPESGRAAALVRAVTSVICQSAKHDRLRGNENVTSPTARPFVGTIESGLEI